MKETDTTLYIKFDTEHAARSALETVKQQLCAGKQINAHIAH